MMMPNLLGSKTSQPPFLAQYSVRCFPVGPWSQALLKPSYSPSCYPPALGLGWHPSASPSLALQVGNATVLDLNLQEEACAGATLHVAVSMLRWQLDSESRSAASGSMHTLQVHCLLRETNSSCIQPSTPPAPSLLQSHATCFILHVRR